MLDPQSLIGKLLSQENLKIFSLDNCQPLTCDLFFITCYSTDLKVINHNTRDKFVVKFIPYSYFSGEYIKRMRCGSHDI